MRYWNRGDTYHVCDFILQICHQVFDFGLSVLFCQDLSEACRELVHGEMECPQISASLHQLVIHGEQHLCHDLAHLGLDVK